MKDFMILWTKKPYETLNWSNRNLHWTKRRYIDYCNTPMPSTMERLHSIRFFWLRVEWWTGGGLRPGIFEGKDT